MSRISFLTIVLLAISSITAIAQVDNYVSTGYCKFQQDSWEKEWMPSTDASFVINHDSREIQFDHTTWASHSLKIDRSENSQTEEGGPLTIYYCTETANGDKWELRFNEWTVFDEATYYHYYQIEIRNPNVMMRFMTKKAD